MRNCPNCGYEVKDTSKFCMNCGCPLPPVPQTTPVEEMAFCPNCGERLQPGAEFCPNCHMMLQGLAEADSSASAPKRRIPVKFIGAAVILLAVIGAAVWVWRGCFASPAQKFISCQQELITEHVNTVFGGALDICTSGKLSTDISVQADVDYGEVNQYLANSSLQIKVDMDKEKLLTNGELIFMGNSVLTGSVEYGDGILGFALPEVDTNYYKINIPGIIQKFSDGKVNVSSHTIPSISKDEWRSLYKDGLDVIRTAVDDSCVQEEKNVRFQLECLGGFVTGTVYTYTPNAKYIEAALYKMADLLEKNEALRKVIQSYGDLYTMAYFLNNGDGDANLEGRINGQVQNLAETLRREAASMAAEAENSGSSWKVYMNKGKLQMIRFENGDTGEIIAYECKGNSQKECREVFYQKYSDDEGDIMCQYSNSYALEDGVYSGQYIGSSIWDGTYFSLDYAVEQKKKSVLGIPYGTYTFKNLYSDGGTVSVSVADSEDGGTDHYISFNKAEGYYSADEINTVNIVVNTTNHSSAKRPQEKSVDISNYSQEELDEFFNGLGETVSQLTAGVRQSLMYSVYG